MVALTWLMSMVNSVEFWAATMVSAESATAAVKERILAVVAVVVDVRNVDAGCGWWLLMEGRRQQMQSTWEGVG